MKKHLFSYLFTFFTIFVVNGQDILPVEPSDKANNSMNFVKFNLLSPLIKNYSFQYERMLSKTISLGLSFRIMPETGLPFKDQLFKYADITEPDDKEIIENLLMSNYAFTPEIRFYTGKKKYGNGFYFSLFYRYGSYNLDNLDVDIEFEDEEVETLNFSAGVISHTGGLMIGSQWALGKHLCLDWWILGPHFGISSGDITGVSSQTLTQEDQQKIRDEISDALDDMDIPMFKYSITTTSNNARLNFDGPWAGLRFGLSFGVKF